MTAATLASIVGSQPPAPTLASSRWTGPLSQHQSGPATFAPLVYPYIHTHASKQRRRLHHFAPTSSRPTPRPNPHSCCTSVPHLPRFRALALFGRRPHQCVARPSMTASENLHTNGPMHCSNNRDYSITSSARASSVGGIAKPIALAVVRLITSSNLVGCSIGRSPGFAPRKILSTYSAARRNRSTMFAP